MTEYHSFEGRVEPLQWGKATYTILRIPGDIAEALAAQKTKRVEGEINDNPINLALTRMPAVDDVFLWAGKTLLKKVPLKPGELVHVRLRKADQDAVDVPDDLAAVLHQAGLTDLWVRLTPGKRRGLIHNIDIARTSETRAKRISALLADLS